MGKITSTDPALLPVAVPPRTQGDAPVKADRCAVLVYHETPRPLAVRLIIYVHSDVA